MEEGGLIDIILLCLYSGIHLIVVIMYIWSTVTNRRNFYLSARYPRFMVVDLILHSYITLAYGE